MEKLPQMNFSQGMKVWRDKRLAASEAGVLHLERSQIESMAQPGGMESVDDVLMDHLASCPRCLSLWAELCKSSNSTAFLSDAADDWYSGGMMEAASSETETDVSFSLPSKCGRFMLRFFPDSEVRGKGMAAFEVVDPKAREEGEGRLASICDADGNKIIAGIIAGGRVARIVEDISKFDLQIWSVVVRNDGGSD